MANQDESLIDLLLADHQGAKKLLGEVTAAGDPSARFDEVVRELVVHEVAEEEIVYPALRRIDGGEDIADARIAEQQEAEQLLLKMERMDRTSSEFKQSLSKLQEAVLAHAGKEEQEVFPRLKSSLDADELVKLGKAYGAAKALAPTHPHPNAPDTPPGNMVLGPFLALIDRARDAARSVVEKTRS